MKKSLSIFGKSAVLAVVLLPFAAHAADDQGVYGTLSLGWTKYHLSGLGGCGGCSIDDTDKAWSFGLGDRINKYVAVEGGYTNLGKASVSGGGAAASEKVYALYLGVVGILPVSETVDLSATVGETDWDGNTSCNFTPCDSDNNKHDIYYGIGASYAVTKQVSIGLNLNRYNLSGDHADVVAARLQYQF
jgi:opacity protein-like surface antigen